MRGCRHNFVTFSSLNLTLYGFKFDLSLSSPLARVFIRQCRLCSLLIVSQSVELGLVFLCSPDWQLTDCDRPERHQSLIRSTTLINLFKQTPSERKEKSFQSRLLKAITTQQGGELRDARGAGRSFIDGLEPESCVHVFECVCAYVRSEELSEESQMWTTWPLTSAHWAQSEIANSDCSS